MIHQREENAPAAGLTTEYAAPQRPTWALLTRWKSTERFPHLCLSMFCQSDHWEIRSRILSLPGYGCDQGWTVFAVEGIWSIQADWSKGPWISVGDNISAGIVSGENRPTWRHFASLLWMNCDEFRGKPFFLKSREVERVEKPETSNEKSTMSWQ